MNLLHRLPSDPETTGPIDRRDLFSSQAPQRRPRAIADVFAWIAKKLLQRGDRESARLRSADISKSQSRARSEPLVGALQRRDQGADGGNGLGSALAQFIGGPTAQARAAMIESFDQVGNWIVLERRTIVLQI